MKFAHFSHVWNKPGMTAAERYRQLWRELALADDCGFDFGFCVEHHFNPNESWMPSPSIYCAAAAAHTTRLRVGTMGFVAPLYDPIRIAEDAAVLDNIANGRLELGLVSGIVPDFFAPYRADFQNRRAITHEVGGFHPDIGLREVDRKRALRVHSEEEDVVRAGADRHRGGRECVRGRAAAPTTGCLSSTGPALDRVDCRS